MIVRKPIERPAARCCHRSASVSAGVETDNDTSPIAQLMAEVVALREEAAARYAEVVGAQATINDQDRLIADVADFLARLDNALEGDEAVAS